MIRCQSYRSWIIICSLTGIVLFWTGHSLAQQNDPIIVDPDFGETIAIAERNLTGYRKFSETIFVENIKGGTVGMDPKLISYAVNADPDFIKTIRYKIYYKNKSIEQTIGTLAEHEEALIKKHRIGNLEQLKENQYKIEVMGAEPEYVDAEFVRSLTGTELFNKIKIYDMVDPVLGTDISTVQLEQKVARDFQNAYFAIAAAKKMPSYEAAAVLEKAGNNIDQYPLLKAVAKLDFIKITFGEPITYLSSEKQLEIPLSLQKKFDVYWVEFAISFRDIVRNDYEEISFNAILPQNSRALELVPLSYAVEQSVQDEMQTPEIGASVGNISISLGEVFKRTVSYKRLKPVIFATGLQESGFSWTMKDDAIENGSQRFIAVIGVPRGALSIPVELSVSAKLKGFLGLQGDIATSGSVSHKVVF